MKNENNISEYSMAELQNLSTNLGKIWQGIQKGRHEDDIIEGEIVFDSEDANNLKLECLVSFGKQKQQVFDKFFVAEVAKIIKSEIIPDMQSLIPEINTPLPQGIKQSFNLLLGCTLLVIMLCLVLLLVDCKYLIVCILMIVISIVSVFCIKRAIGKVLENEIKII